MKTVYIGGYGRSGSTSLDMLLGQHEDITSGGELANILRLCINHEGVCSCGRNYNECSWWQGRISEIKRICTKHGLHLKALYRFARLKESIFSFCMLLLLRIFWRNRFLVYQSAYAEYIAYLFQSLAVGGAGDTVVDSSKTSYGSMLRPYRIRKELEPGDFLFVHLVRHPLSVANSIKKGTNKGLDRGSSKLRPINLFRAYLGWSMANLVSIVLSKTCFKDCYQLIKYEDLVEDPEQTLKPLFDYLGKSQDDLVRFLEGKKQPEVLHVCEGNRMRQQKFKFERRKVLIPPVGVRESLYYRLFCFFIARRFGYE